MLFSCQQNLILFNSCRYRFRDFFTIFFFVCRMKVLKFCTNSFVSFLFLLIVRFRYLRNNLSVISMIWDLYKTLAIICLFYFCIFEAYNRNPPFQICRYIAGPPQGLAVLFQMTKIIDKNPIHGIMEIAYTKDNKLRSPTMKSLGLALVFFSARSFRSFV